MILFVIKVLGTYYRAYTCISLHVHASCMLCLHLLRCEALFYTQLANQCSFLLEGAKQAEPGWVHKHRSRIIWSNSMRYYKYTLGCLLFDQIPNILLTVHSLETCEIPLSNLKRYCACVG